MEDFIKGPDRESDKDFFQGLRASASSRDSLGG